MLDFVRKPFLWKTWDEDIQSEIGKAGGFHLKSIQDLAVYDRLRSMSGNRIAEIGGGASRVLGSLAKKNACWNIEKFEGADGGPSNEIGIKGVTNIKVFLGEYSPLIQDSFFDAVFSVSVVEHLGNNVRDFLEDGLRILKPGGLWVHAIDMYLEDEPTADVVTRFGHYKDWFTHPNLEPVGPIYGGPIQFFCDMASNPDDTMYKWGKIAPHLINKRQRAQSVSIIAVGRRT